MNTSTNCTEISGELPLYVGGELEASTRERVELHLKQCAPCRELLGRAREARAALLEHFENAPEFGTRPSVWPRVRRQLLAEGLLASEPVKLTVASPATPAPRSRWSRVYRVTGLAAAATLLFLLGSLAGRLATGPGTAPVPGERPTENAPAVAVELPPGSEVLRPVAGRALTPVLVGDTLAEGAREFVGETVPLGTPVLWNPGNHAATYTTSSTERPDGYR